MRALAIAILCFCPPLSIEYSLFNPIYFTKSQAFTFLSKDMISSSGTSSAVSASLRVFPISTGSCPTYPILSLKLSKVI